MLQNAEFIAFCEYVRCILQKHKKGEPRPALEKPNFYNVLEESKDVLICLGREGEGG